MQNLKCTTCNCEFNIRNHCNAKVIDLNEKAVCTTRIKRKGGAYAQAVAEFEFSDELFAPRADEPAVICNMTSCAHNKDRACTRETILIGDSLIKTKCFSAKKNKN